MSSGPEGAQHSPEMPPVALPVFTPEVILGVRIGGATIHGVGRSRREPVPSPLCRSVAVDSESSTRQSHWSGQNRHTGLVVMRQANMGRVVRSMCACPM
jgi:hypothetical protein